MFTQCPECKTLVDVGKEKPKPDERVMCDHCGSEFTTRFVLTGEPAGEPDEDTKARYRIKVSPEEMLDQRPQEESQGETAERPRSGAAGTAAWSLGIVFLIAVLIGQYAYFARAELARHVSLRPWLETLCAYAGCEIPLMREPAQIDIVGRDIRRHPTVSDALIVTVTLRNQAAFPQAYPLLELSFYDMAERLVGRRRFHPDEYLPEDIEIAPGMRPEVAVQSTLEIVDPGEAAVNFEFRLL